MTIGTLLGLVFRILEGSIEHPLSSGTQSIALPAELRGASSGLNRDLATYWRQLLPTELLGAPVVCDTTFFQIYIFFSIIPCLQFLIYFSFPWALSHSLPNVCLKKIHPIEKRGEGWFDSIIWWRSSIKTFTFSMKPHR